jgi:hypothetical protein
MSHRRARPKRDICQPSQPRSLRRSGYSEYANQDAQYHIKVLLASRIEPGILVDARLATQNGKTEECTIFS